jgi:hypothetical protein
VKLEKIIRLLILSALHIGAYSAWSRSASEVMQEIDQEIKIRDNTREADLDRLGLAVAAKFHIKNAINIELYGDMQSAITYDYLGDNYSLLRLLNFFEDSQELKPLKEIADFYRHEIKRKQENLLQDYPHLTKETIEDIFFAASDGKIRDLFYELAQIVQRDVQGQLFADPDRIRFVKSIRDRYAHSQTENLSAQEKLLTAVYVRSQNNENAGTIFADNMYDFAKVIEGSGFFKQYFDAIDAFANIIRSEESEEANSWLEEVKKRFVEVLIEYEESGRRIAIATRRKLNQNLFKLNEILQDTYSHAHNALTYLRDTKYIDETAPQKVARINDISDQYFALRIAINLISLAEKDLRIELKADKKIDRQFKNLFSKHNPENDVLMRGSTGIRHGDWFVSVDSAVPLLDDDYENVVVLDIRSDINALNRRDFLYVREQQVYKESMEKNWQELEQNFQALKDYFISLKTLSELRKNKYQPLAADNITAAAKVKRVDDIEANFTKIVRQMYFFAMSQQEQYRAAIERRMGIENVLKKRLRNLLSRENPDNSILLLGTKTGEYLVGYGLINVDSAKALLEIPYDDDAFETEIGQITTTTTTTTSK